MSGDRKKIKPPIHTQFPNVSVQEIIDHVKTEEPYGRTNSFDQWMAMLRFPEPQRVARIRHCHDEPCTCGKCETDEELRARVARMNQEKLEGEEI